MFLWWHIFSVFLTILFLGYKITTVNAFDQVCEPEDSKKCIALNTIRASLQKRTKDSAIEPTNEEQLTMQQQLNQMNSGNDRLGDLLDLNSEPAVEDLMRQIMSQAKLWEAIQEANREMIIQKEKNKEKAERFPLAFSAQ